MSFLQKIAKRGGRIFGKKECSHPLSAAPVTREFKSYAEAKAACATNAPYQDADLVDVVFTKTVRYAQLLSTENTVSMNELNPLFFLTQLFTRNAITVIDIGGACGAHYFFLRKLLPAAVRLDWRIVETPEMVRKASCLATEELSFHASIEKAAQGETIDAVIASGVIQYTPDPYTFLKTLSAIKPCHISIHRTPFTVGGRTVIHIQKSRLADNGPGPLPEGFSDREVEYPETTLSLNEFQAILGKNYEAFAVWDQCRDHSIPGLERLIFSSCYRLKADRS